MDVHAVVTLLSGGSQVNLSFDGTHLTGSVFGMTLDAPVAVECFTDNSGLNLRGFTDEQKIGVRCGHDIIETVEVLIHEIVHVLFGNNYPTFDLADAFCNGATAGCQDDDPSTDLPCDDANSGGTGKPFTEYGDDMLKCFPCAGCEELLTRAVTAKLLCCLINDCPPGAEGLDVPPELEGLVDALKSDGTQAGLEKAFKDAQSSYDNLVAELGSTDVCGQCSTHIGGDNMPPAFDPPPTPVCDLTDPGTGEVDCSGCEELQQELAEEEGS